MRRIGIILGTLGALVLLSGCPKPYPNCESDSACKDHNEVCVQGQCQECATDANCKAGFVCQANKCVPKPAATAPAADKPCQSDKDCSGGKCLRNRCAASDACNANEDCPGGQECQAGSCAQKVASGCDLEPVRFGFNEFSLSSESRTRLEQVADCLKKQGAKVTLEGHADERGTEEYNLQLSNKRAAAVKKYLVDLGVPAAKLDTVGYGENRPAQQGTTEEAYASNRRVEISKK